MGVHQICVSDENEGAEEVHQICASVENEGVMGRYIRSVHLLKLRGYGGISDLCIC